jgi:hypothetical protein
MPLGSRSPPSTSRPIGIRSRFCNVAAIMDNLSPMFGERELSAPEHGLRICIVYAYLFGL